MAQLKQWIGTLVVALALAVLLTRLTGPHTGTTEAASTKTLMIGAAAFGPYHDSNSWFNSGTNMYGSGTFNAPIPLEAGRKITGITVYFYDNTPFMLCFSAHVVKATGTAFDDVVLSLGDCSSGASTTMPNSMSDTFTAYKLQPGDTAFVAVNFTGEDGDLILRGVAIQYK
jgi:hypothetical protein